MSIPSKEELIKGWEYVLTHKLGPLGELEELIQTSINVLRGDTDPNRQKAIDTWTRMVTHEKLGPDMMRRIDATLYYMIRSAP